MARRVLLLCLATLGCISISGQCFFDREGRLVDPAGNPCTNTVLTAVPFLRLAADARSGAMGDVGIGLSPDPNAMHFNASKLVFAEENLGLSATYTPWLRALGLNDVYLAYLAGYYKIDNLQTVGMSIRYFSLGSIPFTDPNGEPLITGNPNEFEIAVAYSRKLTDNFSAALTGKLIYSNLASGQQVAGTVIGAGVAGAADISFTYKTEIDLKNMESDLTVGLALSNIGSKISYTNSIEKDFLPANFGIGAAWRLHLDKHNSLTLATDINKLMVPTPCQGENCDIDGVSGLDYKQQSTVSSLFSSFGDAPEGFSEELKELMYSFGIEYWYDNQFAIRAGYFNEHAQKGGRKYLTAGLGLKYNVFGLNFSYLIPTTNQRNPLDNTLRFSLLFDFGETG